MDHDQPMSEVTIQMRAKTPRTFEQLDATADLVENAIMNNVPEAIDPSVSFSVKASKLTVTFDVANCSSRDDVRPIIESIMRALTEGGHMKISDDDAASDTEDARELVFA